jgi:hypothetical protein
VLLSIHVGYVILAAIVLAAQLALNIALLVKVATLGAEVRVLRELLAGDDKASAAAAAKRSELMTTLVTCIPAVLALLSDVRSPPRASSAPPAAVEAVE